jgi:hypothetical protein
MEGEYDHIVNTVRNPNLPNPFPEMSTVQQRASIRMSSENERYFPSEWRAVSTFPPVERPGRSQTKLIVASRVLAGSLYVLHNATVSSASRPALWPNLYSLQL